MTIRLLRVIGRLNVGRPAIQAITLSKRMEALGYETTLVRGAEGQHEGSMDHLADRLSVAPVRLRCLRRELGPHDLAALAKLTTMLRSSRPDVMHTHAAKAGALGRLAGRRHVLASFTLDRLVSDLDRLYRELLAER